MDWNTDMDRYLSVKSFRLTRVYKSIRNLTHHEKIKDLKGRIIRSECRRG